MVGPSAGALVLAGHLSTAGSASALLSVLQFAIGAAEPPLVGIGGIRTDLPVALVIAGCACGALLTGLLLIREPEEKYAEVRDTG